MLSENQKNEMISRVIEIIERDGSCLSSDVIMALDVILGYKKVSKKATLHEGVMIFNSKTRLYIQNLLIKACQNSKTLEKKTVGRKKLILASEKEDYKHTGIIFTLNNNSKYEKYFGLSVCYAYKEAKVKADSYDSFDYWYNTLADEPVKDEYGKWFDLETGLYFK